MRRPLAAVLGVVAWASAVACVANQSPTGELPGDSPFTPTDAGREGASDAPSDTSSDRPSTPPPPPPPPFDASE
ncbi:MAG TPA: hypothetical protein VIF62_38755 [Labilithrix sp.]